MDKPTLVPFTKKPAPEPPFKDAEDLIRQFHEAIGAGKVKPQSMMVFYIEEDANGGLRPHYWTFNMGTGDRIAFGELVRVQAIEEWRNP